MKRVLLVIIGLFIFSNLVFADELRHTFYSLYNPSSDGFVYDNNGSEATGDQVAVNTYTKKSIQICSVQLGEYVNVHIQGRSKDQTNSPTWATLDVVEFGASSTDVAKNVVVDVTEHVDFLRVGIRAQGTDGVSRIDIRGIFTNLER